ncbi:hypothetical protein [Hafnia alvei]|uniref:Cupin domain-containing protein n=1 Tax=Hafnia alvei TaxID=569 RepID=A0ABD7QA72_HAFAL|nr:hypothetical protein [Hafnia alvei]TBL69139.1 hypothetical protein EYY96_05365 [Hafnia alvei]
MKKDHISLMTGGWFVGNFSPSVLNTSDVEIALQYFPSGYRGASHHHKLATEVTVLIHGRASMAGVMLMPGDILTLMPGESSDFYALEACTTVVIKHPGVLGDKYWDKEAL